MSTIRRLLADYQRVNTIFAMAPLAPAVAFVRAGGGLSPVVSLRVMPRPCTARTIGKVKLTRAYAYTYPYKFISAVIECAVYSYRRDNISGLRTCIYEARTCIAVIALSVKTDSGLSRAVPRGETGETLGQREALLRCGRVYFLPSRRIRHVRRSRSR